MPLGRKMRLGLGIGGAAGLGIAALLAIWMAPTAERGHMAGTASELTPDATTERASEAAVSGFEGRAARLAEAEPEALAEAETELSWQTEEDAASGSPSEPPPMSAEMADAWLADLAGLIAGFERFGPRDRARVVQVIGRGLDRLEVEPTPDRWVEALGPSSELLLKAMADASPAVRAEAASLIGRLWDWKPAVTTWLDQERAIAQWKQDLHPPLVRLLEDDEPGVRLAAVIAMGTLPFDQMAAPAIELADDPVPAIRIQVLNSFAHRPDLLTEEAIFPRLDDPETAVTLAASLVLRARGLSDEQVGLAKQLYSPRAELRAALIPIIQKREDLDSSIWLLRLTKDRDPSIRAKALEALAKLESSDALRRVAEMAESDPSADVRASAERIRSEILASLPPLPTRR